MQVKLCYRLTVRAIPERLKDVACAIQIVDFTFLSVLLNFVRITFVARTSGGSRISGKGAGWRVAEGHEGVGVERGCPLPTGVKFSSLKCAF